VPACRRENCNESSNLFSVLTKIEGRKSICKEAVTCLTVVTFGAAYSSFYRTTRTEHGRFDTKLPPADSPVGALKNEAARQRWDLFHRAIAHAKKSNVDAREAAEAAPTENKTSSRLLSIAR
jgi:hypothetical protein